MDQGLLPRRYAKALYKYASEHNTTHVVYEAMQLIASAFDANPKLNSTIANPFVPVSQKIQLLDTASEQKATATVGALLNLLEHNHRIDLVRQTALQYIAIYRQANNIHHIEITTAAPLADADRTRITAMIEKHLGTDKGEYQYNVDPDLIGGFTVNIENHRLDASVRNELKQLRQTLLN